MSRTAAASWIVVMAGLLVLAGCDRDSPGSPTRPATIGLAGEWTGSTFQGRPISFTVSSDQLVTTITVGYQIGSCSGVDTFSDPKSVTISQAPPGFGFAAKLPDERQVSVQGFLMPDGSIWGTLLFYGPASCGSAEAVAGFFTASRR